LEHTELLVEYLREQYTQARQHETRQTTATSFLTSAAAVLLGFALKDGELKFSDWWIGLIIILIGFASWWVNHAHFKGNRFHVKLAGKTRHAIEDSIKKWPVNKPTELRQSALDELNLSGPDVSIGKVVYNAVQLIPIGVMAVGLAIIIFAIAASM
jgi:hypothetical protein